MVSRMEDTRTPSSPSPASPLEVVAAAARRREPDAFDRLARMLGGRLTAYATGLLRDHGLAEEAVQETFIRVYRFLPGYRQDNFLAWALTIATRVCATIAARERRHALLPAFVRRPRAVDPMSDARVRLDLEAALAGLPLHLRQTFLLHEQGLSYDEIAAVLAVPVGTVRSRLFRARDALRTALAPDEERDDK